MTMLLSACTPNYVLSTTDLRITHSTPRGLITVDEKFNKHILCVSDSFACDITYTGIAQWQCNGKLVRMYNVLADCAAECARKDVLISQLLDALCVHIRQTIDGVDRAGEHGLEVHVAGFHKRIPYPFLACISSLSDRRPWAAAGDLEWQSTAQGLFIAIAFREKADLMVGGVEGALAATEKARILRAASGGANAFDLSNLCRKYIAQASKRDPRVGQRSASVVIPINGWIDTDLWDEGLTCATGFMPTWVRPDGSIWASNEVPIEFRATTSGHFPKDSLFFKSIIYAKTKRSLRRRVFKRKRGKKIPGLFGIIGLGLYGRTVEGYDTLGLEF